MVRTQTDDGFLDTKDGDFTHEGATGDYRLTLDVFTARKYTLMMLPLCNKKINLIMMLNSHFYMCRYRWDYILFYEEFLQSFTILITPLLGFSQVQEATLHLNPETFNDNESVTLTFSGIDASLWGTTICISGLGIIKMVVTTAQNDS